MPLLWARWPCWSEGSRPQFGQGPSFRPPEDFPAFGQPVLAPAGGVVVRAHDRERDHKSRSSWPSLLYLLAEGSLRELTGPSRVLGNHVVLDLGGGVYAVLAHLRRGSLRVAKGQRVGAGEQVADCGTRATPPSRTSTSSSRTTAASCSRPACPSGWPTSRSTAPRARGYRPTAGRSRSPRPSGSSGSRRGGRRWPGSRGPARPRGRRRSARPPPRSSWPRTAAAPSRPAVPPAGPGPRRRR